MVHLSRLPVSMSVRAFSTVGVHKEYTIERSWDAGQCTLGHVADVLEEVLAAAPEVLRALQQPTAVRLYRPR